MSLKFPRLSYKPLSILLNFILSIGFFVAGCQPADFGSGLGLSSKKKSSGVAALDGTASLEKTAAQKCQVSDDKDDDDDKQLNQDGQYKDDDDDDDDDDEIEKEEHAGCHSEHEKDAKHQSDKAKAKG